MKHIFKVFIFTTSLFCIHNSASANFFDTIKSYFIRETPQRFEFPQLTGAYPVGINNYTFKDEKRNQTLQVSLWYPADGEKHGPITPSYAFKRTTKGLRLAYLKKLKPFPDLRVFDNIYTSAVPDAPISQEQEKYPLVIFSHGYGMEHVEYLAMCEELASHGYIVAGINHPDPSQQTKKSYSSFYKFLIEHETQVWIDDVQFVLFQLEQLNKNSVNDILYKKLDFTNVGIFGHSFGGSTAVHMCRTDDRFKAGIDLDGVLFGKDVARPFKKPFMIMLAEKTWKNWKEGIREQEKKDFDEAFSQNLASDNFSEFCKQLGDKAHLVTIKQARHGDFSDVPFLQNILAVQNLFSSKSEMRESLCIGDLEPYRIVSITNDYIVWFFDKYLKGKDRKFPEYSEVIVER
jgi:dienelactone hydrolase